MREDTPPHSSCGEDDTENDLEVRMEFNAMLERVGEFIDERDFEDLNDGDDEELEEVELEELECRLNAGGGSSDDDDVDDGIGLRASPEDKAHFTFVQHASPVFSCHIHPEYDIAVTGGQDDIAYLWDLQNGHVYERINEHTDTVTSTKFSNDGNYLLTADMAGNICVFRLQIQKEAAKVEIPPSSSNNIGIGNHNQITTKIQLSISKILSNSIGDMSWCFWHDRANVVFASSAESGEIYMWRIPSGDCKVLVGPGSCCASGQLTEDGKKLFASYSDGSLRLWDLRSTAVILNVNDQHPNDVQAVACDKTGGALYASGDREGKILFSTQNGPVQSVQTNGIVECLEFSPSLDLKMLASATLNGETTIWDCTHFTKRIDCAQPEDEKTSVCSMKWLNGFSLAIGTSDGDILIFDARSGLLKHKLTGHRDHIYEFCYSRRSNILLSVSEDKKAKLFNIPGLDD